MIQLNDEQQKELDRIQAELQAGMEDARADGFDPESCFFDILEGFAYDIKDPDVRKEFHRINGAYDRQTGYDPLADV